MSDEQKELEQIKSEMNKIRKTVEKIKEDNKFFKDFIENYNSLQEDKTKEVVAESSKQPKARKKTFGVKL